ncbi:MAG: hypothetical protein KAS72_03085 [Phycisphaerales bacterium]|nr:hypothetical protein [Phycisphaerales bacterium]
MSLIVLGIALSLLTGIWLLVAGVRGRKISDHPFCRRCKYDLVMHGKASVCPECGRGLADHRAVRHGIRCKRPRVIAFGSLFLLVGLGGWGVAGWASAVTYDWNRIKPVSWLKREAIVPSTTIPTPAHQELLRRLMLGRLSEQQVDDLVQTGLSIQGDPNATWNDEWGDFIEEAIERGKLTDEQEETYYRQTLEFSFDITCRPKVRAGEPIPFRISTIPFRLSFRRWDLAPNGPVLFGFSEWQDLSINGKTVECRKPWIGRHRVSPVVGGSRWTPMVELAMDEGAHEIRIVCDFAVILSTCGADRPEYSHIEDIPSPLARWTRVLSLDIEVVPADVPVVMCVPDESVRDEIVAGIIAECVDEKVVLPNGFGGEQTMAVLQGTVVFLSPPVDLSFAVFGRHGKTEKRLGSAMARAGRDTNCPFDYRTDPREVFPDARTIDIVLRTDVGPAERTIDITEVWDGEIVIEDVPLYAEEDEPGPPDAP